MNSLTYTTIATLPQTNISELTQLEWAVGCAQINYGKAALLASDAQDLFDLAIDEEQPVDVTAEFRQNVIAAETRAAEAYTELDTAKAILLERWN